MYIPNLPKIFCLRTNSLNFQYLFNLNLVSRNMARQFVGQCYEIITKNTSHQGSAIRIAAHCLHWFVTIHFILRPTPVISVTGVTVLSQWDKASQTCFSHFCFGNLVIWHLTCYTYHCCVKIKTVTYHLTVCTTPWSPYKIHIPLVSHKVLYGKTWHSFNVYFVVSFLLIYLFFLFFFHFFFLSVLFSLFHFFSSFNILYSLYSKLIYFISEKAKL